MHLHELASKESAVAKLNMTLGAIAQVDESGVKWLYWGRPLDTTGGLRCTSRGCKDCGLTDSEDLLK